MHGKIWIPTRRKQPEDEEPEEDEEKWFVQHVKTVHLGNYTQIVLNVQVVTQNGITIVLEDLVKVSKVITHQSIRQEENNDIHR